MYKTLGLQLQHQLSKSEIDKEKDKLRDEFEKAMSELRASYETEQKSKEKLQRDLNK